MNNWSFTNLQQCVLGSARKFAAPPHAGFAPRILAPHLEEWRGLTACTQVSPHSKSPASGHLVHFGAMQRLEELHVTLEPAPNRPAQC